MQILPIFLRKIGVVLFVTIIIIALAYWLVDKPVATFVFHLNLRENNLLNLLSSFPTALSGFVALIYPIIFVRFCYGKSTYLERVGVLAANSVVIATFLKEVLKFVFSRNSVEAWLTEALNSDTFSFLWFSVNDPGHRAFPSGHAAVGAAFLFAIAIALPRFRWFVWILILLNMSALVLLYYHFFSDVIAGALLGWLIATCGAKMMGILGDELQTTSPLHLLQEKRLIK